MSDEELPAWDSGGSSEGVEREPMQQLPGEMPIVDESALGAPGDEPADPDSP